MNEPEPHIAVGINHKTMLVKKNRLQDNYRKYHLYEVLRYTKHYYILFMGGHIYRKI